MTHEAKHLNLSESLDERQIKLLRLYVEHGKTATMALASGKSRKTISDSLMNIVNRLCVYDRDEAVVKARKLGLI